MNPGSRADTPLTAEEFSQLVRACRPVEAVLPNTIAVAVSGGADSMALCLLAHDWAQDNGVKVCAVTVDHGLRTESADEARQVGLWLKARGIEHHILTLKWDQKPAARLQERARQMRYDALTQWCRSHETDQVLVAHHLEDQAETVLMRMRKKSGLMGLAGMRRCFERDGLLIHRPLLSVKKSRLLATLERRNQDWVEDPSNYNMAFERVRTREMLKHLAAEGVHAQRLAATAEALGKLRDVLEGAADPLIVNQVNGVPVTLDRDQLCQAEPVVLNLALAQVLKQVGGQAYGPQADKLERLSRWVCGVSSQPARTLAGCELRRATHQGRDVLTIQPERPRKAVQKVGQSDQKV
ncbi:tRNA lysidine(34) synthetase TilS [Magnetovibrio sp. PR-2]|uniref:tRNA lysidine(34) synthetase TilS n=1 Tax=Magnetovibrio sp. PR-2 TaxID=3120356 RepID=UPI002FCE1496